MRWFEAASVLLAVCCFGCQNAADRQQLEEAQQRKEEMQQHHLYYIEECKKQVRWKEADLFRYIPKGHSREEAPGCPRSTRYARP